MPFIRLARILIEIIFPSKCMGCGSFFYSSRYAAQRNNTSAEAFEWETMTFEKVMAPFLCSECLSNFLPVDSPLCAVCGYVFKSREGKDHLCGNCIEHPKHFGKARALGIYDKTLMEVIHSFKYKEKLQLVRPLEELLFSVFVRNWNMDDFDIVVPVPLHIKRFRKRGFNQAYLLVRDWQEIAGMFKAEPKQAALFPLPAAESAKECKSDSISFDRISLKRSEPCGVKLKSGNFAIGKDVLSRTVWTQPQTGLGRKQRMENIKGAFSICDEFKVEGKKILLVDDVYTTGATVDECAKAILGGGAVSVDVLTLARAV
ncbi:MAG: ComF family protein [Desulfobacterales bacterium]